MRWAFLLVIFAAPVAAETIVATRTIRPQQIITMQDVRIDPAIIPGAHQTLDSVLGLEAHVAVFPGRALMIGYLGEPALIDRNQIVELIYKTGGLRIVAEGRALGRGAAGDRIRVMNTDSRNVLLGTITANGTIQVNR